MNENIVIRQEENPYSEALKKQAGKLVEKMGEYFEKPTNEEMQEDILKIGVREYDN